MNYTEMLSSASDGQKNIVNIWIRSWQLISHVQLRGKSVRDVKTNILLASMDDDRKPGPMKKRADHPQAGEQSSGSAKTSGESKSVCP